MIYIQSIDNIKIEEPTIISLGKFDGLHTGHKLLMKRLKDGQNNNLKSVAFTFDIPPKAVDSNEYRVLSTKEEKERIFQKEGVDYLIECPFTDAFKMMEPEDFLKFLVTNLNVKKIVSGTDFRFGHKARGDYHMLQKYADIYGYEVEVVEKMQYHHQDISSTLIREMVIKGDMEIANELLGYPYFMSGRVVTGNQLGRTIQIPTANLIPAAEKLLPPNGVYVSEIVYKDRIYHGISNIGRKPTVGEDNPVGVEVYIFDFSEDIYGAEISVSFLKHIRREMKFCSLNELKEQLEKDILFTREYFKTHARTSE